MRLIIITIVLSGIVLSSLAQEITISGQIKEQKTNKNIEFATISILSQNDSLITGAVSNDKGFFIIPLKSGNYKLICSYVGYVNDTTKISKVNQDLYLGVIRIKPDSALLEELVISSSSKNFKIDKDVFIVTDQVKAGTSNVKELLERLNGISFDRFNNLVKVDNNSKIVFLVNGLEKNKDYIQNLSPDRIKKIEVLRDPGGRYALEGFYAIINIILKTNYSGNELYLNDKMLLDLDSKYLLPLNDMDVTLNYTYNKINVYGQFKNYYNDFHIITSLVTEYKDHTINEKPLNNNSPNTIIHETGNSITFGSDYFINPKHTISFEANYSLLPIFNNPSEFNSTTTQNDTVFENYTHILNSNKSKIFYGSLFYTGRLSKNDLLKINFNYSNEDNTYDNTITHDLLIVNEFLNSKGSSVNTFFEYNRSFRKNLSIQLGYGNKYYQINDKYTIDNTVSSIQKQDYYTNDVRHLFYSYASWKINKSLSVKVGLSSENSNRQDTNHKQNYSLFQPYFDFLYSGSENFQLTLKYRSEGKYPTMQQTDPNVRIVDPYTILYGNPKLSPYIYNRLSLRSTIFHGLIAIEPYYSFSNDFIVEIGKMLNDSIFKRTFKNSAKYQNIGVKFNLTIPFSQNIILQSDADIFNSNIENDNTTNNIIDWTNSTQLLYINQQNGIVGGLMFQKNMSKVIIAQGYNTTGNNFWMIFFSKPFMNKKLNAMVGYVLPTNFLVDYKSENYIMTPTYSKTQVTDVSMIKNIILLRINYRFNKGKLRNQIEKKNFRKERKKSSVF